MLTRIVTRSLVSTSCPGTSSDWRLRSTDLHLHRAARPPRSRALRAPASRHRCRRRTAGRPGRRITAWIDRSARSRLACTRRRSSRRLDQPSSAPASIIVGRPRPGVRPHHQLAVRAQHVVQLAVALDDRDFRAARAEDREVPRGHFGQLVEQRLVVGRNEFRAPEVVRAISSRSPRLAANARRAEDAQTSPL